MTWVTPKFTRSQVDEAGEVLARADSHSDDLDRSFEVLSNWRSSHSFPLNTIQMGLRTKARNVYPHALIAQRLKRTRSILFKLQRLRNMRLSQMQDIGGCRAVLNTVGQVRALHRAYLKSRSMHRLMRQKDYISQPPRTGYRGIHLIYAFESGYSQEYRGLQVEIQLRSRPQHAWATAVETVGTMVRQSLKSNLGEREWLNFFALAAGAFAEHEGISSIPGIDLKGRPLRREVARLARVLRVRERIRGYGTALRIARGPERKGAHFFLLSLDTAAEILTVTGYGRNQLQEATDAYLLGERSQAGSTATDSVLVSVESLASLERAYPNYFLDAQVFLETLSAATS